MVRRIGDVAAALGDGIKRPVAAEREVAALIRRSWHAQHALAAGTILAAGDVILKRPASGLPPSADLIGRSLRSARSADQPIRAEDLN
jgi:N-acetylneuraminate synthase/N,N'-diacetyllegionaminate synthase